MGADSYFYYVSYEEDKMNALQKLRKREFEAGKYAPVMYQWDIPFPLDNLSDAPAPGKEHATLEEAMEDEFVMEAGTGTILDIRQLSDKLDYGSAYVLTNDELTSILELTSQQEKLSARRYGIIGSMSATSLA